MQIGVVFPQTEIGADVGGVRAYAQAAEGLGYQHLLAADRVVGVGPAGHPGWNGPYTHQDMIHEPFALFAFIAGVAPRLGLAPCVIILPQRQTALVAKQAAELDVLTQGRFRLGVGIGWNPVEFAALGMNFKTRARRFEEQVALMRQLWTQPVVTFDGRFDKVTAAGLNPLPVQRPIPIWVGASTEPAIKRAARIADGFFPQRAVEGGWAAMMEKIRGWVLAAGRDPARFGIEARCNVGTGTPDDWRKTVEEWHGLGVTRISVRTAGGGLSGADAHIARLREARQVLES